MKMTKIMLGGLLAITATANAMPTQEETKKVEPLVMDLMKDDQVALKSGKKTRVEVAESAMSLADKADSEAAKLLLIKGAFNLYVRAGEFDKAIETLQALQAAIPDIPPANMASIIESSLRVVPRKNGGQLYRLLDETKLRMRYTSAAKKMEKTLKENPTDRQLRTKLAEHYAYLGKWDQALENFVAADGKAGVIAKSERDSDATEKVADFWWAYPNGKSEELVRAFRTHAAKLYEDAIAAGKITGLNKVQAERRIDETKEYGEKMLECLFSDDARTTKSPITVNLANGEKIEFVKCPAGSFMMGWPEQEVIRARGNMEKPYTLHRVKLSYGFWMSKHWLTEGQWAAITGRKDVGADAQDMRNEEDRQKLYSVIAEKIKEKIPKDYCVRIPTEAEWEYAMKANSKLEDDPFRKYQIPNPEYQSIVSGQRANNWGIYGMRTRTQSYEIVMDVVAVKGFDFPYEKEMTDPIFYMPEPNVNLMIEGGCQRKNLIGKSVSVNRLKDDFRRFPIHIVIAPTVKSLNHYPKQ